MRRMNFPYPVKLAALVVAAASIGFSVGRLSSSLGSEEDKEEEEAESKRKDDENDDDETKVAHKPLMARGDVGAAVAAEHFWRQQHPEVGYGGKHVKELQFPASTSTRTCLEVDLGAISANATALQARAAAKGCEVMAVVKANAYGHGAVAVSHMLRRCNDVQVFAVATVTEALELRLSGWVD